jgi:hypothetical protein
MHREVLSKEQLALLPLIKLFSKEFYLAARNWNIWGKKLRMRLLKGF